MRPWMSLSTYMKVLNGLRGSDVFKFDDGEFWKGHVKASDIALKTADIVMLDRWSDKHALAG